jgi:hypothetical protein
LPATPTVDIGDVSDSALLLLATYGWAMAGAQSFEYNLAGLSLFTGSIKHPDRLLDTPKKVRKAPRDQFAAYKHRFERASASELRNLLPNLDDSLRAEVNELIELRNELAHRYLRRTLLPDPRANHSDRSSGFAGSASGLGRQQTAYLS